MEAESRYTYVGAAVLLLVAALVGALLWLKQVGRDGAYAYYVIRFEHQTLIGLEVGAEVNVRGVKVGRIEQFGLSDDNVNQVRVIIRVDRRLPVHANTVAVVTRNLVTGIAGVTLVNREPPGPPLTQAPEGERYPVIAEGQSELEEISGRVQQMGEQASKALANLNQLLAADNREVVLDLVRNLRDLSAGVQQRLTTLDRTLERAGSAATSIAAAASQLGAAGNRAALVVEAAGQKFGETSDRAGAAADLASARLGQTLTEAERTLADTRAALAQLTRTADAVQAQASAAAQRVDVAAEGLDDQASAALTELRLSLEAASRVLDKLRDPHAALLGPTRAQLGPGEELE